jgi:serine/threonine protein kinase
MKFCNACGRGNPPESSACERCQAPFGQGGDAEGGLGPGTLVGGSRYEVKGHLGKGGMGSVYLAFDTRLKRDVAVKLLSSDLVGNPSARARMEREAEALARLNHTHVVEIYDVLDHDGNLALVIQYVEGGTLTERLADGALPWREALSFTKGILSGLGALHDAGLVHRDMKPDNVLIAPPHDIAKITDLGVAHDTVGHGMTRQGARLGTPEYMSPEQIQGGEVDARTDLYATGIVLYELLTGVVPFAGESEFSVWKGHIEEDPDLTRLPSDLPSSIHEVIEAALSKDADDRYPTASAMQEALEHALSTESTPQPPPNDDADDPGADIAPPPPSTDPGADRGASEATPGHGAEQSLLSHRILLSLGVLALLCGFGVYVITAGQAPSTTEEARTDNTEQDRAEIESERRKIEKDRKALEEEKEKAQERNEAAKAAAKKREALGTHEVFGTNGDDTEPWLNVRKQPKYTKRKSHIVAGIQDGTRLRVLGEGLGKNGKWWHIEIMSGPSRGIKGYASSDWIQRADLP